MNIQDIKENIRFFKPNDPYYYEVDNLPLIDLLNNDKILRDEINAILTSYANFATEGYVQTNLQAAIGDVGTVDINGTGTLPNNIIAWINQQNFLTETATNLGDLLDVDTTTISPTVGNTLIYDTAQVPAKWVPGGAPQQGITYLPQRVFVVGQERTRAEGSDNYDSVDSVTDRNIANRVYANKTIYNNNDPFAFNALDSYCHQAWYYQGPLGTTTNNIPGSNNIDKPGYGHATFRIVRSFDYLGLPQNTKKIYGKVFIGNMKNLQYASQGSTYIGEDAWMMLSHNHSGYTPKVEVRGTSLAFHDYDYATETILYQRIERFASESDSFTYNFTHDFCIDYQLPITDLTMRSEGDPLGHNPWNLPSGVAGATMPGNCLYLDYVFYNKCSSATTTIYIYGYEAWD